MSRLLLLLLLLVVVVWLFSFQLGMVVDAAQPQQDHLARLYGAVLFEHPDYQGRSQFLPEGLFVMSGDGGKTVISSAKVLPGSQIIFYESANFTGVQTVPLTGDIPNLHALGIGRITASALVERAPGVMVFEHGGYGGAHQFLPFGEYGPSKLFKNDAISSLLVSSLTRVVLYDNFPVGGNQLEVLEDMPMLSSSMNDRTSGIRVTPILGAKLFKEPYFSGKSQYFEIGRYKRSSIKFPDQLGSMKLQKGLKISFFLKENFTGPVVQLEHDWTNFTSIELTSIESLAIEAVCSQPCYHGECIAPNKCRCWSKWQGPQCDKPLCTDSCNNGACMLTHRGPTCQCSTGWGGPSCTIPICETPCKQGNCVAPAKCECYTGWGGPQCDQIKSICGDMLCHPDDESCVTCPEDCGPCPPGFAIEQPKKNVKKTPRDISSPPAEGKLEPVNHGPIVKITAFALAFLLVMLLSSVFLRHQAKTLERTREDKLLRGKLD